MSVGVRYVVSESTVTRQMNSNGSWRNLDSKPSQAVHAHMGGGGFNSELLPPGVRLLRTNGEHTQVLVECPPAINRICWSRSEGEGHAGKFAVYLVAQPYRIIHAHYRETQMIGARMFYRPRPLYSFDDELYHVNLPNINCEGYHNTGVGWVCFYGDGSTVNMNWSQRIARLIERCSGSEGYNGNMSHIDGKHHYQANGAPSWTYSPSSWEKKSDKHGVELALQDNVWLPVLVNDQDDQLRHTAGGRPLTVGMAVNGRSPMAYGDTGILPGINAAPAEAGPAAPGNNLLNQFNNAYAKGVVH